MKPMKVAAVIAGSLVAAGAAAPAFAAEMPSSLNGGVEAVATQTVAAAEPVANQTLNTEEKGSLLNKVGETTKKVNQAKDGKPEALIGGLPVPH
ncbi:hypothetical protein [Streptomyces sp. NPDC000410]|uniref:hypothetical protein n=1 Tax=Streptomyces sp. NPDC000410 TaxID=3154254 RepID=UPI003327FB97